MSDELHRVSTRAFLNALGGPTRMSPAVYSVTRRILAILRLRRPGMTSITMLEDYVYGWDECGGVQSNSVGVSIGRYNRKNPHEPILSVYGAGYFLSTPELNALALKGHSRNEARLALQETAQ